MVEKPLRDSSLFFNRMYVNNLIGGNTGGS